MKAEVFKDRLCNNCTDAAQCPFIENVSKSNEIFSSKNDAAAAKSSRDYLINKALEKGCIRVSEFK